MLREVETNEEATERMTADPTEEEIRQFIAASFLAEGAGAPADGDDLFALLDSLQVLRLVVWIEEHFGVPVPDGELTGDNFGTVGRVATFVRARRKPAGAGP